MPPKKNPLGLNNLQLKTLTLLQELARHPGHGADAGGGAMRVGNLPQPHGNHFHVGDAVVMTSDASGLSNPSVWIALERKGLIRDASPLGVTLTDAGLAYDTGAARAILHRADH